MYNLLVTGGNGQLGSELKEIAPNFQDYNFLFTDVSDLDITNHIAVREFVEVYNYSNEGVCSWYDFSKAIFELKKLSIKVNPIEGSQFPSAAKRPFFSVLNKTKIKKKYGIEIPHWRTSLIFF